MIEWDEAAVLTIERRIRFKPADLQHLYLFYFRYLYFLHNLKINLIKLLFNVMVINLNLSHNSKIKWSFKTAE